MSAKTLRLIGASIAMGFGMSTHYLFDGFAWQGFERRVIAEYFVHATIISISIYITFVILLRKRKNTQSRKTHIPPRKRFKVIKVSLFTSLGICVAMPMLEIILSDADLAYEGLGQFLVMVFLSSFVGSYVGLSLLVGLRNQEAKTP